MIRRLMARSFEDRVEVLLDHALDFVALALADGGPAHAAQHQRLRDAEDQHLAEHA